jgi:hypothetical protein
MAEYWIGRAMKLNEAKIEQFMARPYDNSLPVNNRLEISESFAADSMYGAFNTQGSSTTVTGVVCSRSGSVRLGSSVRIVIDKVHNRLGHPYTIITAYPE